MSCRTNRRWERWTFAALLFALAGPIPGQDFQIGTLSTDGCRVIDHDPVTGDDRGGIAVSAEHVFYTGDGRTGVFDLADLGSPSFFGYRYDALTSNLRTGTVYTLAHGDTPIASPGGTVTALLAIDETSGGLTGERILLSPPIPASSPTGIFAGYDRIALYTGNWVYDVALPSGKVRRLGPVALPGVRFCESWAFWGVAEHFAGSLHLVYRQVPGARIARTRVPDGETTTVAEFTRLGDMCGLTVSPETGRWYFHHEGFSQLALGFEILGFCDAAVGTRGRADLALTYAGPEPAATVGTAFTATFTVTNEGPAPAAGTRFEGRLPATLELLSVVPSQGRCHPGCETLVCELGQVRAGESATITVDARPLRGSRSRATARVHSRRVDADPADNEVAFEVAAAPGTATLFSLDAAAGELRALDAGTGTTLARIPLTLPGAEILGGTALAAHPLTGELWTLLALDGQPGPELAVVDPQTGEARRVGETSPFSALTFDAGGTLYGVESGSLYAVDQSDATATPVLDGGVPRAAEIDPRDGRLYSLPNRSLLRAVDLVSAAVVDVELGDTVSCSLGFSDTYPPAVMTYAGGNAFLVVDGLLHYYRVTTAGERTVFGSLDHFPTGLAWVELPRADLAVTQTASPEPAAVGAPLTYEVTVTNDGPERSGATLVDPVPGTVSLVAATPSQGACRADACSGLTCVLGELDAGGQATVSVEVVPRAAGTLAHPVTVPGLNDPDPEDNRHVAATAVTAAAPVTLLSIDRFSDRLRTLDPLTGATLTDGPILLPDARIFGGSGLATHPRTGALWALLQLSGQAGRELVVIDPATRVATRVGDTGDLFAALAFDAAEILYGVTGNAAVTPAALFVLSQDDATPTFVRSLIDDPAFLDTVGESLAFNPADGLLYQASSGAFDFELQLAAIDPGLPEPVPIPACGDTFGVARALTYLGGDVLLYTDDNLVLKSLTSGGVVKTLGPMDHVSKGLAFVSRPAPADLSLIQTATPDPVAVGGRLTYTLTVRNQGPVAVADVSLVDALPATASLVAATSSRGTCATAACGELTCDLGELGPGDGATVTLAVTPFATGPAVNTARLPFLSDADPADNESAVEVMVGPRSFRRDLVSIGRYASFFDTGAVQLYVVDPHDATTRSIIEVTTGGATVEAGVGLAAHPLTGELWALLALAGQEGTELVRLVPSVGLALRVGNTGDRFADLAFDAAGVLYGVTATDAATPGSLFVIDQGDATPTFVASLADGGAGEALAFNPQDGLLYHAAGDFALEAVDPGGPTVTPVTMCVDPAGVALGGLTHGGGDTLLLAGGALHRLTTSGGLTRIGGLGHDSGGLAWADLARGDLAVTQTAAPDPVAEGERLVYTLTVKNRGADVFPGVRLVDDLPGTARVTSVAASRGVCEVGLCGGELSCALGDLEGGAEATVTVEVRPLVAGTVTNRVLLPVLNDPDLGNNQTALATRVRPGTAPRALVSVSRFSDQLRVLDPLDGSTLSATRIVVVGGEVNSGLGLATQPETGELFALLELFDQNRPELVTLNPATGVARRVGATELPFVDLAFAADGTLYGVARSDGETPEALYVLDPADATATFVVALAGDGAGGALAFHGPSGRLYEAASGLWRAIDPHGPTVENVPACRELVSGPGALTHLRGSFFLLAGSSGLFGITTTGTVTRLGSLDRDVTGLAFVEPNPRADVSVTVADSPDPATVGGALTYTVKVRNAGPGRVPGVTLLDEPAPTVSLVAATPSRGACEADLCGELACELGDLAPGAEATVAIAAVPWAAGTVEHAAAAPVANDPRPGNNRRVTSTRIRPFSNNRLLFAAAGPALEVLDPFDGSTVDARPVTLPGESVQATHGLARHPSSGELWALLSFYDRDGYELVTLDPTTGDVARRIGDTGAPFDGLTFDAGGTLYTLGGDDDGPSLFVLSPEDARATRALSFEARTFDQALAFNPADGLLYRAFSDEITRELGFQAIEPGTFKVRAVTTCPLGFSGPTALIHLGGDTFLLGDRNGLFTLTAGGVLKRVVATSRRFGDMAFVDVAFADLAVTQTAAADPAAAGAPLTYTVTVTNKGPDAVADAVVVDTLPGTVSLLAATPSQGACALRPCRGLVCALGPLAAGQRATVTLTVRPLAAGSVTNRALATSINDPNPDDNASELTTAVAGGDTAGTLLSISFTGELTAIDLADGSTLASLAIELPGRQVTGGRGLAKHPVTGELWALLALQGQPYPELVTVDPVTGVAAGVGATGDDLTALAFDAGGTLYGLKSGSGFAPAAVYILDPNDASASFVVALPEGRGGTTMTFHPEDGLLYHAGGSLTLTTVDPVRRTVTDVASCADGPRDSADALTHLGGDRLLLAAGTSLYGLDVLGGVSRIGTLEEESAGLALADLPLADLAVTQSDAPDPVAVGSPLTYTLSVRNQGPDVVDDAFVFDALPGTMGLVAATPSQGACGVPACGSLACALGPLAGGQAATVTVEVTPFVAGTWTNAADAPSLADPEPADNRSSEETTVVSGAGTPILVSLAAVDFRGELRIVDPAAGATRAVIPIALPGSIVTGGAGLAVHPATGELWALLLLAGRDGFESALVTLDPATGVARRIGDPGVRLTGLAFDREGTLYSVASSDFEPITLYVVSQTDASLTRVLSFGEDESTAQALAFNPRDGLLYLASGGLTLRAVDPRRRTVDEIAVCATPQVRAMTYLGGDVFLLAGSSSQLHGVTTGGGLAPAGTLDHDSFGLAFVRELPAADVAVAQTVTPGPVTAGSRLTYTLSVRNHGPDAVPEVVVFDDLPATASLVSARPSQGACTAVPCGGGVTCALGRLAAGAEATVTLEVVALAAGELTNTISVPVTADPDRANNVAALAVTVRPAAGARKLISISGRTLRAIDPQSGATLAARDLTLPGGTIFGSRGLAAHPITGELWALLEVTDFRDVALARIEPATGVTRSVGFPPNELADLAFGDDGTLYGVSYGSEIFVVSRDDASTSLVVDLDGTGTGDGLAFSPRDGRLYHATGALTLSAVDLDGVVEAVATCPGRVSGVTALTHFGRDVLLLAEGNTLWSVTTRGALAPITTLDHFPRGLAFADELPAADLTVTQAAAPDPAAVGERATYTVTVRNRGPQALPRTTLLDELPGPVSLGAVAPSQGACAVAACTSVLTCDLGKLGAGRHATVTFDVTPWLPGTLTSTATAPVFDDPEPEDNESVLETAARPGDATPTLLSIDRESSLLHTADLGGGGEPATVTITAEGAAVEGGRGLARHPLTGELWALLALSGQAGSELAVVDPTTGEARRIGDTGGRFVGLAFDAAGTLYGVTDQYGDTPESLFVLDQDDAAPSFVVSLADEREGEALAFNPADGLLYHASGGLTLNAVDAAGPTVTEIAGCQVPYRVEALTHLGGDVLLAALDDFDPSVLYAVSTRGSLKRLGGLDHVSAGLAFLDLPLADLAVAQSAAPDPVAAGERTTLTVTVANGGPQAVPDVVLFETLPATVDVVAVTASQGTCAPQRCGGLLCDFGRVEAGGVVTVAIEMTALAAGTLTHTAFVPALNDPDQDDNRAVLETAVLAGDSRAVLVSLAGDGPELRLLDPQDGSSSASTRIALAGSEIAGGDGLAAHPATGELWALLRLEGQEGSELIRLDAATGAATAVGDTGDRFAALAFDDGGTLYGLTDLGASTPESLFALSQTDAAPTFLLSLADGIYGEALAFNPQDGLLYHASGSLGWEAVDPHDLTRASIAACTALPPARALTHLGGGTLLLAAWDDFRQAELYGITTAGGVAFAGDLGQGTKGLAFVELPRADLAVDQSDAPDPVTVGSTLTYTVTVANHGPDAVPDVVLADALPGTVDVVSAAATHGTCGTVKCGGLACDLGELGAGEAATLTIAATPLLAGRIFNVVEVPLLGDLAPDDNQSFEETRVEPGEVTPTLLSIDRNNPLLEIVSSSDSITITLPEAPEIDGGRGLAVHPLTGELWALLRSFFEEGDLLVVLDPISGVARLVGDTGNRLTGLAFDADGTLYALADEFASTSSLYVLDQTDATPSLALSLPDGGGDGALAFSPVDGRLYHGAGSFRLSSVDPEGRTVTEIATCFGSLSSSVAAMTHLGGNTLLLADNGLRFYAVTTAGGVAEIGTASHFTGGLAFVDLPRSDLSVSQTAAPDPAAVGSTITYTVTVANHGPDDLPSGVTVRDVLPGTVSLVSAVASQGTCGTEICGGLVCDLGALSRGGEATVTIEATPLAAGSIANTVSLVTLGDPEASNNESAVTAIVEPIAGDSAPTLLSLDGSAPVLRVVDPATGSTLASTTLTLSGTSISGGNGLAVHPVTGELWAILRLESQSGRELVTLDPATGVVTPVGDTGDNFAALAFAADGTLYGLTGAGAAAPESLFVLSQTDGTPSFVLSLATGMGGQALAFNPFDGRLYHASGNRGWESVSLSDLTRTTIATCGSRPTARALAYLGEDVMLLATENNSLYGITSTGSVTLIGALDHFTKGLAFVDR